MSRIRQILVKYSYFKDVNDKIEKEIEELIKEEVNNHCNKIRKEEFYELLILGKYKIHLTIENDTPIILSVMDNNGDDLKPNEYLIR